MLNAGTLTFQEFTMHDPLSLATIHNAVLEFLQGRDDTVLSGAQAVNAYVKEPRMTQDIDVLSLCAAELAQELRDYLKKRFRIAVRIREVGKGRGYRLYQVRKSGNRHLVDIRSVETLPSVRQIEQVLVMAPADLIASKVVAYHKRRGKPKSGTDWRDLAMLLLTFPELKTDSGPVSECLQTVSADPAVITVWKDMVAQEILSEDEEDEF
jgi:hypothetical protein